MMFGSLPRRICAVFSRAARLAGAIDGPANVSRPPDAPRRAVGGGRRCGVEPLEGRALFAGGFSAAVDFAPDDAVAMAGYVADAGQTYGVRPDGLTFGWDVDVTKQAKLKESAVAPDERYETFITPKKAIWELAVPNGDYVVRVVAGDGTKGRKAKVDVEGVPAVDGKTTKDARWLEATVTVSVADGRLTVSPGEGYKSNRLAFLEVAAAIPGTVASVPATGGDPNGLVVPAAPAAPVGPPAVAWAAGVAEAPQTRVEAGVARIGTKLYVMGGYVNGFEVDNTTDVFDAATGTWAKGPDFPGAQTHAGVATDGVRYIYKVAGQVGGSVPGTPTNEAWQLDTVTNLWSPLPPLPVVRYAPAMVYVNNQLHLFAGDDADRTTTTNTHWALDLANPAAGWVAKAAIPEAGDHISTEVIGGQVYAIGGEHGHAAALPESNAAYVQHNFLFRYDPATDAWTRLADVPTARSHAEGTTVAVNGKIVMMGGKLSAADVSDAVQVYDPATDTWAGAGNLPQMNQGGAAIYYDGKIYLAFGQEGAPDHTMWRNLWVGVPSGI
jgi:N-acetylneuraminic acid mutarotase